MKYLYIATFFALLLSFVSAKGIYCTRHIIIKHGDRCRQIYGYGEKKQYYVRFKDLMIMNPTLDCDNLSSGTKVCVEAQWDKNPFDVYTIKKGDTCKSIAKSLKTTISVLENTNLDLLVCNIVNKQVGVEIDYRKDGDYTPIFKKSNLVSIDGN
ncbi:hypothetical protein H8356DRAFT_1290539 [Neocallimastix lanati (nom. inval.)]|jgi:diacylglycerol kinase family enzyme|uniref:LysM domain-containing protein n=1 Tax=Neocallimastix californiae TaxID=1754190 RepID=A0A1Y2D511_9FUNG|nr:hypothetical protein H8356DRAFT_1290539 [Neocallimastix sp. JGI-2020a]ORY54399.1 hypothetical protein LY90DRAFT_670004 [Neocallimastix californiae]|eukprot:ORY54399.1 hypothetical protein LY90DRAFT_670004 [Neocallimastix californiae]